MWKVWKTDKESSGIRKLKKIIRKEFGIKHIDIKETDNLLKLSERIVIKWQNCSLSECYEKGIINPNLHLPGGVCSFLILEFSKVGLVNKNNMVKDLWT